MTLSRRGLIANGGAAAALATPGIPAVRAADYPSKPIRVVVGFVPGGGTDLVARIVAEGLGKQLGQTVVVENKPGASASIGLDYVAKSPPDGYTLAHATGDSTSLLAALKPHLPYDIATDLSFIARAAQVDFELVVSSKQPYRTLPEMVAYARANPGKIRYGSSGVGSSNHLAALLLSQQAGIQMTHVPYKGGDAMTIDLLSGVLDTGYLTLANIKDYATSDRIRVIAVTSTTREPSLPDVPTMPESGYPGAVVYGWQGLLGPAKLPPAVVDRLAKAMTKVIADPTVQQRMATIGFRPAPLTGPGFRQSVLDETRTWKNVADTAHLVVQ